MNKEEIQELKDYHKRCIESIDNYYLSDSFYEIHNKVFKKLEELHNKINKLEDKITQMHKRFINGLCIDNYLGGRKTKILFEEMFEILKDSDVDD